MSGSLAGPILKLKRAEEHLDQLDSLMTPFIREETDRIRVDFDAKAGCKVFALDHPRDIPPEWGPIIGDVLFCCRSSLDQFANQLAGADRKDRITSWPIHTVPDDFICKGKPAIRKMPPEARTFVENAQPYKRSNRPEYDLLALLNGLSNEDKHRQLPVAVTSFEGAAAWGDFEVAGFNWGPVVHSEPIFAVYVEGPEVDVPLHLTLEVAFADRRRWGLPLRVYDFFVELVGEIQVLFVQAVDGGLISRV